MPAGMAALFTAAGRDARRGHHLRLRLRARPAHQRRRAAGRHDARHRMPAHRRRGARRRAGAHARRHQPRAARHRGRHARAGAARWPSRCSTRASEPPPAHQRLRRRLPRRRGRHRRLAPEGPLHRPDLRLRRQRRAGQGARAQGLGPLDPRLSPARCARPGRQAPSRRAAALRRPRDGGRLHAGRGALRHLRARAARRSRASGSTPATLPRRLRHRRPAGARVPARRPGRHAAPRGLGPGLRAADLQRRGRGGVAAAGRREAPGAQAASTRGSRWTASGSATPSRCRRGWCIAFRLDADEWQGVRRVRFLVEGAEL